MLEPYAPRIAFARRTSRSTVCCDESEYNASGAGWRRRELLAVVLRDHQHEPMFPALDGAAARPSSSYVTG